MSLKAQVVHGLKWQAISIVGRQLLSMVVFTSLARLLSPSAFGLVALVSVYLGFVAMFIDQGIATALIQRQNPEPGHLDTAFWFNMGCAIVLCLGTIILAGPISLLFHEPRLIPLLRWSSLGLIIGASSAIHATLFTKAMDFRQPVIRGLIANVAGGIVGIGMALTGCGVWSLVGQQLAGEVAGAAFLWGMSNYRPSFRFSWLHLRQLFGFSSSVFAASILWYFSSRLDQMVVGRFYGAFELGLYSIAGKIPNLANMLTQQPVASVSLPALSKLQEDHARMRQTVYQGMELNAFISFAVFVGVAAVAPELVPLLFGAKWASAAALCSLLSLYSLMETLQVFSYPILLASGGIGKYVLLNVWHVIGVLVACFAGVEWGVNYLVLGLILNSLILAIPVLLFLRQRIGLSISAYCRPCCVPAVASLLMVGAIWLLNSYLPADFSLIFRLLCKVIVGGVVYIGCTFLLAPSIFKKLLGAVSHAFRRSNILKTAPTTV